MVELTHLWSSNKWVETLASTPTVRLETNLAQPWQKPTLGETRNPKLGHWHLNGGRVPKPVSTFQPQRDPVNQDPGPKKDMARNSHGILVE